MNISDARKKAKQVDKLLHEFGYLDSLIKAMDKTKKEGLDSPQDYYENVKKRREKILAEFDKIFIET